MDILPIWKKATYTMTAATTVEFSILKDGEIEIFHGIAQPNPYNGEIKIELNKICGSYLNSKLPFTALNGTADTVAIQEGYHEFVLKTYDPMENEWNDTYTFGMVNDTSYETHNTTGCYSEPINGHCAPGQILPYSYLNAYNDQYTICYEII